MKLIRQFSNDTRGATAVEFALILVPLILLIFGLIEFGRAIHVRNAMDNAIDHGQRMIIIDPSVSTPDLTTRIRQNFAAGDAQALAVSVTDTTSSGTNYRLINLTYNIELLLPFTLGRDIELQMNRQVVVP